MLAIGRVRGRVTKTVRRQSEAESGVLYGMVWRMSAACMLMSMLQWAVWFRHRPCIVPCGSGGNGRMELSTSGEGAM